MTSKSNGRSGSLRDDNQKATAITTATATTNDNGNGNGSAGFLRRFLEVAEVFGVGFVVGVSGEGVYGVFFQGAAYYVARAQAYGK